MASNYPTSIDAFPDPLANSPLNAPSHSALHQDVNDAVEKIETKLGVGVSPASGASAGQVLMADGSGNTAWTDVALTGVVPDDISSAGRSVRDVIIADGAGSAEWSSNVGLWLIFSGTFAGNATPTISNCFSASFENYLAIFNMTSNAQGQYTNVQLVNGATPKTTNYNRSGLLFTTSGVVSTDSSAGGQDGFRLSGQSTAGIYATAEFFRPFTSSETGYKCSSSYQSGNALQYTGAQTENYSATGFRVISSGSSVTYTGTIRVYGYRN